MKKPERTVSPRDLQRQRVAELREQSNYMGSFYRMTVGKHLLRLLPFPLEPVMSGELDVSEATLSLDVPMHFVSFGKGHKAVKEVCPLETSGTPCPICQLYGSLMDIAEDEDDKREAYNYKVGTRFFLLVIPGGTSNWDKRMPEASVQIMEVSAKCHNKMWDTFEEVDSIIRLDEDGCDVIVTRIGEGFNTDYEARPKRAATKGQPIAFSPVDLDWLRDQTIPDLSKLAKPKPYDELLAVARNLASRYGDIGLDLGEE